MGGSLRTRLFLLLAGVMAVSAIAWAIIFTVSEIQPRSRQLSHLLTSIANLTRFAVVSADPSRRAQLLTALAQREGIRIYVEEEGERLSTPIHDTFLEAVETKLQETLGPGTRLALERDGERALFLSIDIEGDDYWIALPMDRIDHSHSLEWIGWGLLAAAIAFLAAGYSISRLTRPLLSIAEAAAEIGVGRHPPSLPETGPEELRMAARAFNRMNTDLATLEQDRTLMLAGVSHDLRTPLTRLRMGIEMAVTDPDLLQGMGADIEEMDHTIGQFLDFARQEGDQAHSRVDLAQMVTMIADRYRQRGITMELGLAPVLVTVHHAGLQRAIINLIDNALRYGGNAPLLLRTSNRDDAAYIEVADRGPGIPPDQVERIKRPFTRLENARSNTEGSGLGLAIVDRIARQHNGRLELLPRDGGGLLARIVLPLEQAPDLS
ncbi:MAG: HAMP domain-containing protein [Proteobacteria bacterium]|nr:HAMP domain-containing protein [Pseudomonadota bacterium]HQR03397.1 ATP-binding protein [Rhodocyclaceae bacterium]